METEPGENVSVIDRSRGGANSVVTTKLYLASRSDLAKLEGPHPPGYVFVRVIPISSWTPESVELWVVVGTDPADAAEVTSAVEPD